MNFLTSGRSKGNRPPRYHDLVLEVRTTGAAETFTLPLKDATTSLTIEWGDETTSEITTYNDADLAHEYADIGTYNIRLLSGGTFGGIRFVNTGDKDKIYDISTWGNLAWTHMAYAFMGCSNLQVTATDTPDLSANTSLYSAFQSCTALTSIDVTGWDVSGVTSMFRTFLGCSNLATITGIGGWDTSSVGVLTGTFQNSDVAALDLSLWDTSSLTLSDLTFSGCSSLATLDVSGWDVTSVKNLANTFSNCSNLESLDLSSWVTTTALTSLNSTWWNCEKLTTVDVTGFVTSSVTYMNSAFGYCDLLATLDLSGWSLASCINLNQMFTVCPALTTIGDVSAWDVSSVTSFYRTMMNCTVLTGVDISTWNISAATSLSTWLSGANSAISTTAYDAALIYWDTLTVTASLTPHMGDATYNAGAAATAHASLISGDSWTITDGGVI